MDKKQFYSKQVHSLVLFDLEIGPYQVLPLRARVDLGAMSMKRYSTFLKVPVLLESHHQSVYCHIQDTCRARVIPLQRCSRCILQLQPTGPSTKKKILNYCQYSLNLIYGPFSWFIFRSSCLFLHRSTPSSFLLSTFRFVCVFLLPYCSFLFRRGFSTVPEPFTFFCAGMKTNKDTIVWTHCTFISWWHIFHTTGPSIRRVNGQNRNFTLSVFVDDFLNSEKLFYF